MEKEKAYKVLALQEGISNSEAKSLIDRGLVYAGNKKVMIARGDIDPKTNFKVEKVEKIKPIFQNNDLIVVDKPAFVNSDEIERQFREKAIKEFKNDTVYKEYSAWIDGILVESVDIDKAIITEKKNNKAYSKISKKGKPARTEVTPEIVNGKKTKVKCVIHHGRTHQIRVHLKSIDFPIIGDEQYGGRRYKRVMLHARKVVLLGMTFEAPEPTAFKHFES